MKLAFAAFLLLLLSHRRSLKELSQKEVMFPIDSGLLTFNF